ncbi:hypothetical protein [Microcoleus vaginatus]|uniref:hypothetical protein n=1 Tax=Microcoleus vaginatus TaxID=119532 RepID=UPI00404077F3
MRELFEIEALPDYQEVVGRYFEDFIAQGQFNANQIQFLKAVQNVFLKTRQLEFRICMRHRWISFQKRLWNAGLLRSG